MTYKVTFIVWREEILLIFWIQQLQIWQANASNDFSETGALIQLGKPGCCCGIHQDQCVQSELSSCGFQKVTANKNRMRLDYAGRIHITELSVRFVCPTEVYWGVIENTMCWHTVETMQTLEGHLSFGVIRVPWGTWQAHVYAVCILPRLYLSTSV